MEKHGWIWSNLNEQKLCRNNFCLIKIHDGKFLLEDWSSNSRNREPQELGSLVGLFTTLPGDGRSTYWGADFWGQWFSMDICLWKSCEALEAPLLMGFTCFYRLTLLGFGFVGIHRTHRGTFFISASIMGWNGIGVVFMARAVYAGMDMLFIQFHILGEVGRTSYP